MGFEKCLMNPRHRISILDDDIGLGEAKRHIAAAYFVIDNTLLGLSSALAVCRSRHP
jgi:hypothetical protein